MDSPINTMKYIINELSKNKIKRFKGKIISTGTYTFLASVKPNITLEDIISNLAEARANFIK